MGLTTTAERAHTLIWALIIATGAFLFTRKSALAQTMARGAAWSVILPTVAVSLISWSHGFHPPIVVMLPAMAAGTALLLARPLAFGEEARATFAPIAIRSWLLASATAAIGAGLAVGTLATAFASVHLPTDALVLGSVALSLLASGIGVMRMRAWGVLAGALSSVVAVLSAIHFRTDVILGLSVLATVVPGLMMTLGVLAARAGVGHPKEVVTARIASSVRVHALDADAGTDTATELDVEEPLLAEVLHGPTAE